MPPGVPGPPSTLPRSPATSALGVYLHVPFCRAICHYCNFNRGLLDEPLKARYVAALAREVRDHADGSPVDTIYFGGGTPSLLAPQEVAQIIDACRSSFAVDHAAEITLETNPDTVDRAYLAAVRAAGVNRLSIGVQSFQDAVLGRLGRTHTAERARGAVADARAVGFDNISLDLMMWLPGQDLDSWLADVDTLIDVAPDHASLYLMEIYPNAPLRDEMARQGWTRAADDLAADMYLQGLARLDAAGYAQYEISNVARDGSFAWHNVKYWTDGEWLGLGCGAHGTRGRQRWRNVSDTADYVARVAGGVSPRVDTRTLSPEDALADALFMGLRLVGGIDLPAFGQRWSCDIMARFGSDLAPFAEAGLVTDVDHHLRLTRQGMLLANEVMAVFV